jgi:hypothetical protein
MNVTVQLDSQGAEKFASRIGVSCIIAAIGAASAGAAALILAIHQNQTPFVWHKTADQII